MVHDFLIRKRIKSNKPEINSKLKMLWPIIFSNAIIYLTHATIAINMAKFSELIWPGDSIHFLEMGLIISLGLWAMAISGVIIGALADRYSRKILLIFALILAGTSNILNGLAPTAQGSFTLFVFLISSILSGFGIGGIRPILLSFTNDYLEKDNRSKFFGRYYSIGFFAIPLGMIFSAVLIQNGLWNYYFWIIGGLLVISALLIALHVEEPERGMNSSDILKKVLSNSNSTTKYDYRLNKTTLKSTILRPTNIIALLEGIFTWILFGTVQFLMMLYLQQEPNNISSISVAWFMIIFAIPGTLLGNIIFSKKSDQWGKNIKNRLNLIILALFSIGIIQVVFFLIPLPGYTLVDGNNILFLLQSSWIWVLGILLFARMTVGIIYNINQPPVLQAVNLPEAQGKVSSWNQFLETIGQGIGPTIASMMLMATENNFVSTALILLIISVPGALMWAFATRYINRDVDGIEKILSLRAEEISTRGGDINE